MQTYQKDLEAENAKMRRVLELLIEELDDPCRRMPLCTWDAFGQRWVQDKTSHTVHLSLALDKLARAALS